jgi:plastocyanin
MSLSRYFGISAVGALALGFALATAPGCGSDDDHEHTGGSGGATGGSGGATGGSGGGATGGSGGATGGSGGATGGAGGGGGAVTPAFKTMAPCTSESDYMKVNTIGATAVLKYSPPCVQIKKGGTVKFDMNLEIHPLKKSTMRSDADNPIVDTATGTMATFTFPKSGFFGFYCNLHGATDTGTGMAGVVWVTD